MSDNELVTYEDDNLPVEQDGPKSVRDTIRESYKEVADRIEDEPDEELEEESEEYPTRSRRSRSTLRDAIRIALDTQSEVQPQQDYNVPPSSLRQAAKELWSELPDIIKEEFYKRENDTDRGVKSLKKQYQELDEVIKPRKDLFKHYNKTPAQAINQLLEWNEALASNPDQAFPALLQSYGITPDKMMNYYLQDPTIRKWLVESFLAQEDVTKEDVGFARFLRQNPNLKAQYKTAQDIYRLKQERDYFESVAREFQKQFPHQLQPSDPQTVHNTQQALEHWASDKPYFQKVRFLMGMLLTPDPQTGESPVPLLPNGQVDLDTAYEVSVWANPDTRSEVFQYWFNYYLEQYLEDQAKKEQKKSERDAVKQARNRAASIQSGTPDSEPTRMAQTKKGRSVRDSLRDAIDELANR